MPRHAATLSHHAPAESDPTARRTALLLTLLALVIVLGWEAGTFLGIRRSAERLLAPPTQMEMNGAIDAEAVAGGARRTHVARPLDAPVAPRRMLLWLTLPLAGTTLLVLLSGRRR